MDDDPPDLGELHDRYGLDAMNRVKRVFGVRGSPDSKPIGKVIVDTIGITDPDSEPPRYIGGKAPTKMDKGGLVHALNSNERLFHIRLEFLRLTVDEDLKPHVARARLQDPFGISLDRIQKLTKLPKHLKSHTALKRAVEKS